MIKITRLFEVLIVLVHKDLKAKYKHSYLGYLWSIALPLAQALVFFAVFKVFIKIPMENYPLFLITGLFMWQWIANSISTSASIYLANASLVKKVAFERSLLPLSVIVVDMFHFIVSSPIIIGFLFYYGSQPTLIWFIGIPIILVAHILFVFGISLIAASVNIFFRDVERILNVGLMLWFYLTPILYPISMVPDKYKWMFYFNPAAPLVIAWRSLFLDNIISWEHILYSFVYGITFLLIAIWLYNKLKWRFAEVI